MNTVQALPRQAYDEDMDDEMMDDNTDRPSFVAVDELLRMTDEELDDEPSTGRYDVSFFNPNPSDRPPPVFDRLSDARVGLSLFIDEAFRALELEELTVDQRVHIATIVSYIEGLADRFDRVRVPGFVQASRKDKLGT